jgi:hypothetical protein
MFNVHLESMRLAVLNFSMVSLTMCWKESLRCRWSCHLPLYSSDAFVIYEFVHISSTKHISECWHQLNILYILWLMSDPGDRSRYSDWLWAGRPRGQSSSPGSVKNISFSTSSRPALGPTQRPIQWVLRVKRPGLEADHSLPTSSEVKIMWIYTSTPPYVFMP